MKKIIFITLLNLCAVGTFYAQNVVIQSNNPHYSQNDNNCEFKINGICSTEDIGGVDFERLPSDYKATNYNSFTVTVLVLVNYECNSYTGEVTTVVTKVLKSGESKYLNVPAHCRKCVLQSITRRVN